MQISRVDQLAFLISKYLNIIVINFYVNLLKQRENKDKKWNETKTNDSWSIKI